MEAALATITEQLAQLTKDTKKDRSEHEKDSLLEVRALVAAPSFDKDETLNLIDWRIGILDAAKEHGWHYANKLVELSEAVHYVTPAMRQEATHCELMHIAQQNAKTLKATRKTSRGRGKGSQKTSADPKTVNSSKKKS